MTDAGFRWAVVLALGVIAMSLYALSGMVAFGMSRRLAARDRNESGDEK